MNNKETILTGIKNLKMQIKRLMTEVHALENMVGIWRILLIVKIIM